MIPEHVAFGWNRHFEARSDEAIQRTNGALRSLDCFAIACPEGRASFDAARDDGDSSTQKQLTLPEARPQPGRSEIEQHPRLQRRQLAGVDEADRSRLRLMPGEYDLNSAV